VSSWNQLIFRTRRWWIIPVLIAVGVAGGFLSTKIIKPEYKSTCRLFVAVANNTAPGQTYQAAVLGQARVAAYLDLIHGDRVAAATIDALHLNISTADLRRRIAATADAESVLMNVSVTDPQPSESADIANAVCTIFQSVVADAEGPNSMVNVRLVEKAIAPEAPSSPNAKRNLAAGALVGLLLGLGLMRVLAWNRSLRGPASGASANDAANVTADSDGELVTTDNMDDSHGAFGSPLSTSKDDGNQHVRFGIHRKG
jgi:capsular polysaccharide biosynthesis protein